MNFIPSVLTFVLDFEISPICLLHMGPKLYFLLPTMLFNTVYKQNLLYSGTTTN